jgi:hypothetical protein
VLAKERWLLLLLAAVALGAGAARAAVAVSAPAVLVTSAKPANAAKPANRRHARVDRRLLVRYVRMTRRRQAVMGLHRATPPVRPTLAAFRAWRRLARQTYRAYVSPPHKRGWLCIHRYEATWGDSGDPYWGGLQMDRGFMEFYAPKHLLRRGWADRWSPLEQMWVAERAYRLGRGFSAWPNTARLCGLI